MSAVIVYANAPEWPIPADHYSHPASGRSIAIVRAAYAKSDDERYREQLVGRLWSAMVPDLAIAAPPGMALPVAVVHRDLTNPVAVWRLALSPRDLPAPLTFVKG